jgi:hypothetical protein
MVKKNIDERYNECIGKQCEYCAENIVKDVSEC